MSDYNESELFELLEKEESEGYKFTNEDIKFIIEHKNIEFKHRHDEGLYCKCKVCGTGIWVYYSQFKKDLINLTCTSKHRDETSRDIISSSNVNKVVKTDDVYGDKIAEGYLISLNPVLDIRYNFKRETIKDKIHNFFIRMKYKINNKMSK